MEDEQATRILATPPATGLLILRVLPERSADRAGVQPGDILTHYGKSPVATLEGLQREIRRATSRGSDGAGTTPSVTLRLLRKGRPAFCSVPAGLMGVETVPLRRGFPIRRHAQTVFTPHLKALRNGETWFALRDGGKRGFARLAVATSSDGGTLQLDHATRARLDGPRGADELDLRVRLDLSAAGRNRREPALRFLSIADAGKPILTLDRVAFMLTGAVSGGVSGDRDVTTVAMPVPERVLPMQALPLMALTMPRQVGATQHLSLLDEAELRIRGQYELRCAAQEPLTATTSSSSSRKPLKAFRYDATRFGVTTHRYWITADHRLMRAEYVGSLHLHAVTPEEAVRNLPAGLNPTLAAPFSPMPTLLKRG